VHDSERLSSSTPGEQEVWHQLPDQALLHRLRPAAAPSRPRRWLHLVLLALTVLSTTAAGAAHYASFLADFGRHFPPVNINLFLHGFWYSGTILGILGCHEMGHYLACRYYGVDASLPYFIPAPILTGTLGAFIRIREPFRSKRVLFDVGVAGPIAGFVVAVPALLIGLSLSHVVRLPPHFSGYELGEPLLFKGAAWLVWGNPSAHYSLNLHPMAFAAWFGLLATALNLFPIGQFDGGHISYAIFGRRSTIVTLAAATCALVLSLYSSSWIVWTVLIAVMLFYFGPHHPSTLNDHVPLGAGRVAIAVVALVIFILCFTPAPIEVIQLLPR
jgi:membrane-associated protease RseP (regulator of RpoE activity)